MSLRYIKQLCKLQGIQMHPKIPVICPRCSNKTMEVDVESGEGVCYTCQKKSDIKELVAVYEEEELEKYKDFKNMMEDNKGVGGNY